MVHGVLENILCPHPHILFLKISYLGPCAKIHDEALRKEYVYSIFSLYNYISLKINLNLNYLKSWDYLIFYRHIQGQTP